VVPGEDLDRSNQFAYRPPWDASLVTPDDARVHLSTKTPLRVEHLIVSTIIGNKYTALIRGEPKLLFVGQRLICAADFVNRDCVNAALAQSLRDPVTDVFVKEEG
jgi:hypothetical protein